MDLQRSLEIWEASQCSLCGKPIQQDGQDVLEFHFHSACAKDVGDMLRKIKEFEQVRTSEHSAHPAELGP